LREGVHVRRIFKADVASQPATSEIIKVCDYIMKR
jgi:hypothetical protein